MTLSEAYLSIGTCHKRVNGNSLVGCIGGETNFKFQQKVGTCERASLYFFVTFHLSFFLSVHMFVSSNT